VGALLLSVAGCSGLVWSGLWLGLSGLWLWFSGRWLVALVWSGQGSGWGFRGCGSGSRVGGWLVRLGLVGGRFGLYPAIIKKTPSGRIAGRPFGVGPAQGPQPRPAPLRFFCAARPLAPVRPFGVPSPQAASAAAGQQAGNPRRRRLRRPKAQGVGSGPVLGPLGWPVGLPLGGLVAPPWGAWPLPIVNPSPCQSVSISQMAIYNCKGCAGRSAPVKYYGGLPPSLLVVYHTGQRPPRRRPAGPCPPLWGSLAAGGFGGRRPAGRASPSPQAARAARGTLFQ